MDRCDQKPSISAVVMAYNEAADLEATVCELEGVLDALGRSCEIIVVDDGSADGTGAVADRLAGLSSRLRVIHHAANIGLGGVYATGFKNAKCDFITFFPADGQFPASIIGQFLPLAEKNDMVLGYLPRRDCSFISRCLSRAEKILYGILFGPLPRIQGVMMFRRSLLDEIVLRSPGRSRGWAIVLELIIRASRGGYKIISVPTEIRPRMSGRSKVNNPPTIWANLRQAFLLRGYL